MLAGGSYFICNIRWFDLINMCGVMFLKNECLVFIALTRSLCIIDFL